MFSLTEALFAHGHIAQAIELATLLAERLLEVEEDLLGEDAYVISKYSRTPLPHTILYISIQYLFNIYAIILGLYK